MSDQHIATAYGDFLIVFAYLGSGLFSGACIIKATNVWMPSLSKHGGKLPDYIMLTLSAAFGPLALIAAAIMVTMIYCDRENKE